MLNKKVRLLTVLFLAMFVTASWADRMVTAADVLTVKTPHLVLTTRHDSAEVFMELDNASKQPEDLIAAYSPVAKQVQLHRFVKTSAGEKMQQVPQIEIKPNSERDLAPGGFHVMLIRLQQDLRSGNKVPITLVFADGSHIQVQAVVTAA